MWNFARTIQKKVILASLLGMKSGFFFRIPSAKKGKPWRIIHIDRKTESLWQVDDALFGGTRRVWSIMSYWSLAKRLIQNTINNNWSIWTVRCLKNDQNTKRGNTRSFFSMTMLHHMVKPVRDTLEALSWEVLPHAAYSPDLAPPDYHLFASMGRTCWAALWFVRRCEKMARWMVCRKRGRFFWRDIHKLSERWEKCVMEQMCNGAYFE